MAISQDDRISISRKIVEIPKQDAQSDKIQGQIEQAKIIAQKEDDSNKQLMDDITVLINLYQQEIQNYDGTGRTTLTEQDMIDSVNKKLQNPFFPNDSQVELPSIPDGVWKNFQAFSGNKAIGKAYEENYLDVDNEQDTISEINSLITLIEAKSDVTRSTGQECITGACTLPQYDNQAECELNGGTWSAGASTIQNDAEMQQYATDLKAAVQDWEDLLNSTFSSIPTAIQDGDATRSPQNQTAKDDASDAISIIDTWQALADFDTSHGQTTCSGFNGINVSTLDPTKFRAAELQAIKDEVTARLSFITTRLSQLNSATYFGSINQDFDSGEIISADGFYGNRFRIIDMRLNLIGGSLSKLKGLENAQNAQEEAKKSNENAAAAYSSVIVASLFRSPATGNNNIHVLDSSGFGVSDTAYVIANNQQEIEVTITAINGNRVTLDKSIPTKYRETDLARLYKVL